MTRDPANPPAPEDYDDGDEAIDEAASEPAFCDEERLTLEERAVEIALPIFAAAVGPLLASAGTGTTRLRIMANRAIEAARVFVQEADARLWGHASGSPGACPDGGKG